MSPLRRPPVFRVRGMVNSLHRMSVTDHNSAATGRQAAPSELVLDATRPPFPGGFRQILLINGIATLFCASVICLLLWRQTMADWIAGWWLLHLLATGLILIDWYSRRPRPDALPADAPPNRKSTRLHSSH